MKKDRLAVILTTWRRLYRTEPTLEGLARQTFNKFDLYVWNNNRDPGKPEVVDEACTKFADQFPIQTVHAYDNFRGRGRQILARHLRIKHGYQYVCFLDDDLILPPGMLTRLWDERQPTTVLAQRVWKASSPAIWPKQEAKPGEMGFYGMAAGAIIDTELFAYDQYWSLWPERFWPLDDLWMSAMARAMGFSIVKSSMKLRAAGCSNDQNAVSKDGRIKQLWDEFAGLYNAPQGGRYGRKLYEGPLP